MQKIETHSFKEEMQQKIEQEEKRLRDFRQVDITIMQIYTQISAFPLSIQKVELDNAEKERRMREKEEQMRREIEAENQQRLRQIEEQHMEEMERRRQLLEQQQARWASLLIYWPENGQKISCF